MTTECRDSATRKVQYLFSQILFRRLLCLLKAKGCKKSSTQNKHSGQAGALCSVLKLRVQCWVCQNIAKCKWIILCNAIQAQWLKKVHCCTAALQCKWVVSCRAIQVARHYSAVQCNSHYSHCIAHCSIVQCSNAECKKVVLCSGGEMCLFAFALSTACDRFIERLLNIGSVLKCLGFNSYLFTDCDRFMEQLSICLLRSEKYKCSTLLNLDLF